MRFRKSIVLIPGCILLLAYLTRSIRCSQSLAEITGFRGDPADLIHLVVLGFCVLAALLIIKHGQGR